MARLGPAMMIHWAGGEDLLFVMPALSPQGYGVLLHASQLSCPRIAVRRTACFRTPMSRASTSSRHRSEKDVDGRDKPGHDECWGVTFHPSFQDGASAPDPESKSQFG